MMTRLFAIWLRLRLVLPIRGLRFAQRCSTANHRHILLIRLNSEFAPHASLHENLDFPILNNTIHTSGLSKQDRKRTVARMTGHPSVFTSQVRSKNISITFLSLDSLRAAFVHLLHLSMTTRKAWHINPMSIRSSTSHFVHCQS
jgi:hypothetical protein